MIVAADSNVLGYAQGVDDAARQAVALRVLRAVEADRLVIPVQALAELFSLVRRKTGSLAVAQQALAAWSSLGVSPATTGLIIAAAAELAGRRQLQIFDAIIRAAAASAGADMLLSEDMQDGFAWRGVTVVNPFAATPHPLLAALLA